MYPFSLRTICSGSAWSSDFLGHMVTYAVVVTGTAGWLERWTTPLLGSNPVTWAVLYAVGLSFPDRPSFVYSVTANRNNVAELVSIRNPTVTSELSFSAGISVLLERVLHSTTEEAEAEEEGVTSAGGVFSPRISVFRPLLVAGWVLVLVAVIPAVPMLAKRFELSKVASRKVFHALATVMFVPAIALEVKTWFLVLVCFGGVGGGGGVVVLLLFFLFFHELY